MELIQPLFNIYLPTIIYSSLVSHHFFVAVAVYLSLILVLNYNDLKNKFLLPISSFIGFIFFLCVHLFVPTMKFHPWLFSAIIMFMATSVSILIGKPFSTQYSRLNIPESKWKHPIFLKVNVIISSAWSVYFAIALLFNILSIATNRSYLVESSIPLALTIFFTLKFPDYYRNKKGKKIV